MAGGFVKDNITQYLPEHAVNVVARQSAMNVHFPPKAVIRQNKARTEYRIASTLDLSPANKELL